MLFTLRDLLELLDEHHDDEGAPLDTEVVFEMESKALRFGSSEYNSEEEIITVFIRP